MKKSLTLFVPAFMLIGALSAIFASSAYACEYETIAGEPAIISEEPIADDDTSGFVYDENGNIVDYWFGDSFTGNEREPFFAYPNCSSHNWQVVSRYRFGKNSYYCVYNKRCSKCCRYMYDEWSLSSNI